MRGNLNGKKQVTQSLKEASGRRLLSEEETGVDMSITTVGGEEWAATGWYVAK